ncbi:MAG TPA: nuclear transport factor 2 family protein [Bryobacteraceae bacterium]|nr:nuclear transport factor 2 family protein [Bryobacteraceae bacterium]
MRSFAVSVLGLLMVWGVAVAQHKSTAADEAALKALEEKWDAASLKGDTAALGTIFADGFISTSAEGKVRTKAEMLAQIKSGDVKYQMSKVDDLKVLVYGDAAVVNGRWKGKFVEKGKNVDTTERFTDTFVRQNGQWRCVASQGSTIK